jgi:hypothetical protein
VIELLKYSGGTSYLDIYSGSASGNPTAYIDINNDFTSGSISAISSLTGGFRTATTDVTPIFSIGDSVVITESSVTALNETVTVSSVVATSPYSFTYATSAAGTFTGTAAVALAPIQLSVTLGTAPYGVSQRWQAVVPEIATTTEQEETVTWSWTQSARPRGRDIEYNVVAPYVHPVDAAYRLGFSLDPTSPSYRSADEVYAAEKMARYAIEAYTGEFFGNRIDTTEELGQGTDILVVPNFITTVHKLWENDTLVYHAGVLNNFGYPIVITDSKQAIRIQAEMDIVEYSSEYTGNLDISDNNYYKGNPTLRYPAFRDGWNYKVQGQFGFESVPSEISECAIMLINDYLCADSAWRRKYVTDIKTSDWAISFGSDSTTGTGNATVDAILDGFSRHSMLVI